MMCLQSPQSLFMMMRRSTLTPNKAQIIAVIPVVMMPKPSPGHFWTTNS